MNIAGKASKASSQDQPQSLDELHSYIVTVIISFCAINHSLRSIFGEELSMNLSRLLDSKGTNEYSGQSKQSEFTRLVPSLRCTYGLTVGISISSLCLSVHLLRLVVIKKHLQYEKMIMRSSSSSTEIILNLHHFDKIYLQSFDKPAPF